MPQLDKDDALAVDVFLESRNRTLDASDGQPSPAGGIARHHLDAADKLFSLVAMMPAQEPPVDLVERTLDVIDADRGVLALDSVDSASTAAPQPEA